MLSQTNISYLRFSFLCMASALLLFSCASSGSRSGQQISCQGPADCPEGFSCNVGAGYCSPLGDQDAELEGESEEEATGETDGDSSEMGQEGCVPSLPCLEFPALIDFGAVPFGDTARKTIRFSNAGKQAVTIYSYQILPAQDAAEPAFTIVTGGPVDGDGEADPEDGWTLNPGDPPLTWTAVFSRFNAADNQAVLLLQSSHQAGRGVEIPMTAYEKGAAKLSAEPNSLSFPDTSINSKAFLPITLTNTPVPENSQDSRTLTITSIEISPPNTPFLSQDLNGQSDGSACFGTMTGSRRFLGKNKSRQCLVKFNPSAAANFTAQLVVNYSTPQGTYKTTLPLSGRGTQPLAKLSPESFCDQTTFKDVTVNFSRRAPITLINASRSLDKLHVNAVSVSPSEGPFGVAYLPKPISSQDASGAPDVPPVELDRGLSYAFFVEYKPVAAGSHTGQVLKIETDSSDVLDGVLEVPLCGTAVPPSNAVEGLVLGVPALGADTGSPGENAVLPVAHVPISVMGKENEFATVSDTLGHFALVIPKDSRPSDPITLNVDGTRASNGPFSAKQVRLTLLKDAAVQQVIVLGRLDDGNAQANQAQDQQGVYHDLDGVATSLDEHLSDIRLDYERSCLAPGPDGESKVSMRRASLLELPVAWPGDWSDTPDPMHIYRFLPLGLSFSCSPGATLQLPNSSGIGLGTKLGFYMLDGDNPPTWVKALSMLVIHDPASTTLDGTVIVTQPGPESPGIRHFGKTPNGYDSIGFLARPLGNTYYSVHGYVKQNNGSVDVGLGGIHVELVDTYGMLETTSDTDGYYNFSGASARRGVPGQHVLIGAYRSSVADGSWLSLTATLPVVGNELTMPDLIFPPKYETGFVTGYVRYDSGQPVGVGGLVNLRWVHPDNLDADPANDNPSKDVIYADQPILNGGVYYVPGVRATNGNRLRIWAVEPKYKARSAEIAAELKAGETITLNLEVPDTDTVAPFVRNAYPLDGSFNFPTGSSLSLVLSEALNPDSLISSSTASAPSIRLLDRAGTAQPIRHFFDEARLLLVVQPTDEQGAPAALLPGKRYTLELTTDITDKAAIPNHLARRSPELPEGTAYRATFRTVPPSVDDQNECTADSFDYEADVPVHANLADDSACGSDGISCTFDVCRVGTPDPVSHCTHPVKPFFCLINDTLCVEAQASSGANSCLWCNPVQTATQWTIHVGAPCDDHNPRTLGDVCDTDGICQGSGCVCTTIDECCDGCLFRSLGTPCGDTLSSVCDRPDTCDGKGVCQANYEATTTVCREAVGDCDAAEYCDGAGRCAANVYAELGKLCNDLNDCSKDDACDGNGNCIGLQYTCPDTQCRIEGVCGGNEGCRYTNLSDDLPCDDDDPLTAVTACRSGLCTCIPNCENRACGDDGCGGNCGLCPGGIHSHGVCKEGPDASSSCELACDDDYWDLDGQGKSECEYHCVFQGEDDEPDLGDVLDDRNCDGFDGSLAASLFVSAWAGDDNNIGTMAKPKKTLTAALQMAMGDITKTAIILGEGSYYEGPITLLDGVGIYGGYQATVSDPSAGVCGSVLLIWSKNTAKKTEIQLPNFPSGQGNYVAVFARNLTRRTVLQRLTISIANNAGDGSYYGIYARNADMLVLQTLEILIAQPKVPVDTYGAQPRPGYVYPANSGLAGGVGVASSGCAAVTLPTPPNGATAPSCSYGTAATSGGAGGGVALNGSGSAGGKGAGGGGNGGGGGSVSYTNCQSGQNGTGGAAGAAGMNGQNGSAGGAFGTIDAATGYYVPANAPDNSTPGNGGKGGGGGGGGGGNKCIQTDSAGNVTATNCYSGSTGGSGGAGGCGGPNGRGGRGGSGVFGIFLFSTIPQINDCQIVVSHGTAGSSGESGYAGQPGGTGTIGKGSLYFNGGAIGGSGGNGGNGGHGGGGGGGPSYCIYATDSTYHPNPVNLICSGYGGGAGGASLGNKGATGAAGISNW